MLNNIIAALTVIKELLPIVKALYKFVKEQRLEKKLREAESAGSDQERSEAYDDLLNS